MLRRRKNLLFIDVTRHILAKCRMSDIFDHAECSALFKFHGKSNPRALKCNRRFSDLTGVETSDKHSNRNLSMHAHPYSSLAFCDS
jgi:hypothetical protein